MFFLVFWGMVGVLLFCVGLFSMGWIIVGMEWVFVCCFACLLQGCLVCLCSIQTHWIAFKKPRSKNCGGFLILVSRFPMTEGQNHGFPP